MIIYIDKSIGIHCQKFELDYNEKLFFNELALEHQRGDCLLIGEINSLDYLSNIMGGFAGSMYKKIMNRYSETRSIVNHVEFVIIISYVIDPNIPEFFPKNHKVLLVNDAINYKSCKPTLLCENLNDNIFYKILAKRYVHTQNIKSVELSLHDESGGGLTIYASLEKCIKEDKVLTLCIADSDIKYGRTDEFPNEPAKGDTVNKLISTYKRMETNNQPLMCELYCPPINEIENLIPMSVLAKIAEKTDPNIEVGLVFLNKLLSANLVEALLIYDFKKGIKKFKEGPHKSYWQQIGTTINDNSFPLINAKILIHTLNYWEELLSEDSNNINIIEPDSYLENLWNIIGRKVFSWGCANKAIRS